LQTNNLSPGAPSEEDRPGDNSAVDDPSGRDATASDNKGRSGEILDSLLRFNPYTGRDIDSLSDKERADKERRDKLISSIVDLTIRLEKDLDDRVNNKATKDNRIVPWQLNKGSVHEMPRIAVPTTCTSSSAVCLAYLLISQITDINITIVEEDCPITMELTPELNSIIDGMTLCVRQGKKVTSGSFGGRRRAVDNGFAIAMAQCCTYYCQEADKDRGYLMDLIPDDLKGTKEVKKASTELFGKIRTLFKKDENEHFVPTLIWLFNKWAHQHADSIGRSVMRCQKIGWEKVKRKALPHKNISRRVKGKTTWQTQYSSPKNVGASPLLSSAEKTLLKSLAKMGYYDVLQGMEDRWKAMPSWEQHDHYNVTVDALREMHKTYSDSASRVCGRQYKRRQYFERATSKQLETGKKKKADPKALSKHLADITREVFGSAQIASKIPLQTSCWCLIVNTQFEDMIKEADSTMLTAHFGDTKAKLLRKNMDLVISRSKALIQEEREAYELFISTNQFSALDDGDNEMYNTDVLDDENG
jgi:hypothetical protein